MTTGQTLNSIGSNHLHTDEVHDYSNILAANPIHTFKSDIKNHEKLLIQTFFVTPGPCYYSNNRYIIHRLYIIKTVKEGPIFCTHPEFTYIESLETKSTHRRRIDSTKYIDNNGKIYQGTLSTDYCEQYVNKYSVKYTVRLHPDDLLCDIMAKALHRQGQVPSLAQLCFLAIPTYDLPQYNDMNRT